MRTDPLTRRAFLGTVSALSAGVAAFGLKAADNGDNRLTARPVAGAPVSAGPGLRPLGLRHDRDALLYIPESSAKWEKAPLVISLHGATRDADRGISLLRPLADQYGFLLLAPASEAQTWDAINGPYAGDVSFINRAMARTYEVRRIDPARIAMAGFSDGASYSLSIGLANGDLFSNVLGFSSGFIIPGARIGKPPVFMSHGTIDPILPIDICGRPVAAQLKRDGYRVIFREFEGKHTLPPEIAAEAMRWFMKV
jgi:phospholipase/carboxylesterase